MKILQQFSWTSTSVLLVFIFPFSNALFSQDISPLDKYFTYTPADQNTKQLNFVLEGENDILKLGFDFENYKNTEKGQSLFQVSSEFSNDYRSIRSSLGNALGLGFITQLRYSNRTYLKDKFFVGGQASLFFGNNGNGQIANLRFVAEAGIGRIYRVEEWAMSDRIISRLQEQGLIESSPNAAQRDDLTSLIARLRNNRTITNRGDINSELEVIISSLQDSELIDESSNSELVRKIINDSYKYEFLRPRETGQSISLTTHQDYFLSNLNPLFEYNLYDKRVGLGFSYDKKEYINERLQWNTSATIDLSNNTRYSTEFFSPDQEYFSAHASVATRLDFYPSARSRFGYQFSVAYDHYELVPNWRFAKESTTIRFDFDYEYQLSRKSSITFSNYWDYSKFNGLGVGIGVKLRF